MIGIDHSKASIESREKFAFTKSKVILALNNIKEKLNVSGVVIISTCNRSEIWLSGYNGDLYKIIESIYGVSVENYKELFTLRRGKEAVNHLFCLSCGLESKIIGEDQILTQVKESATLSREEKTIDIILEKLFQIAITSAKKVKTNIRLTAMDASIASRALDLLYEKYREVNGLNCLVIGNGEVGTLAAKTLSSAGLNVKITLRQYKRGAVVVPEKCDVIPYEDRLSFINWADVIVSGTLSPHYTLKYDEVRGQIDNRKRIFIDLAMPRDIECSISNLKNCELYDVDTLSEHRENKALTKQVELAKGILNTYINEFYDFYYYRDARWMNLYREKKVEGKR